MAAAQLSRKLLVRVLTRTPCSNRCYMGGIDSYVVLCQITRRVERLHPATPQCD